jgi:hypothetical protein
MRKHNMYHKCSRQYDDIKALYFVTFIPIQIMIEQ